MRPSGYSVKLLRSWVNYHHHVQIGVSDKHPVSLLIVPYALYTLEFCADRLIVAGMLTILSAMVSLVSFRFRRRAYLELEVLALRHQLAVLRRQRPRRTVVPPR